jgi:nucleotide-binding universal stress UspA family protein
VVIGNDEIDLEASDEAATTMREYIDRFASAGLTARGHVIAHVGAHAEIGRVLADRANELDARLVVLGPSRRTTLHSGQSSTIDELWRTAKCNVLLVGRPENDAWPDRSSVPRLDRVAS